MALATTSTDRIVERRTTNSRIIKRSIIRNGHKSSVSLEDQFWDGLCEIAKSKKLSEVEASRGNRPPPHQ